MIFDMIPILMNINMTHWNVNFYVRPMKSPKDITITVLKHFTQEAERHGQIPEMIEQPGGKGQGPRCKVQRGRYQ